MGYQGGRRISETNGHAPPPPAPLSAAEQLREARAQRRLREEQVRLRSLERSQSLLESYLVWNDWGMSNDLWERVRLQATQTDGGAMLPPNVPSDRRAGANWPLFRNEFELNLIRQRSRVIAEANSFGEGLLRNLVNYGVGDGFQYEVISKEALPDADLTQPGHQDPDWLTQEVARAQDALDDFLRLNGWNGAADPFGDGAISESCEQEAARRLWRDGEVFFRLWRLDGGETHVRFVEPVQVRNPPGATEADGWSYGIRHQTEPFEDVKRAEAYHVDYASPDYRFPGQEREPGELVEAEDIVHVKAPGTDSTVKRGLPLFRFDTADALERASKLQRCASVAAAIKASVAETWQHAYGTQAQITTLAAGRAESTRTNPVTGQSERVVRFKPGMIRDIPQGRELVPPAPDQTQSYLAGVQGDLRMAASAVAAPEYLASGDASNANYASTKEAGTPFVHQVTAVQSLLKAAFLRVVWRALRYAARSGRFSEAALDQIDVQCEAPQIVLRDSLQQAQEDQIGISAGWDDPKSAAMRRGYDWETIQANKAEIAEAEGQAGPPLDDGGGGDPFGGGLDDFGPLGGGGALPGMEGRSLVEQVLAEAGFTGIDSRGHKWVSGKQVKKGDDGGAGPPKGGGSEKAAKRKAFVRGAKQKIKAAAAGVLAAIKGGGKKAVAGAKAVAAKGQEIKAKVNQQTMGRLEAKAPKLAKAVKALHATWTAAYTLPHKLAVKVAENIGGKEHAAKVANVLTAVDTAAWAAGKVAGHVGGVGVPGAGKLAGAVVQAAVAPVASVAYLAYAVTARPAIKLAVGAGKAVKGALGRLFGKKAPAKAESVGAYESAARKAVAGVVAIMEAGFTGTVTDTKGRKLHYLNGKRVAAPAAQGGKAAAPKAGPVAKAPPVKPAKVAINAHADKVKAINAKVTEAKAKLAALKQELKAAKADAAKVKAAVAAEHKAKGPTKADVAAKEAGVKLQKLNDDLVARAQAYNAKVGSVHDRKGRDYDRATAADSKGFSSAEVESEVDRIVGKGSFHKAAAAMGFQQKFKSVAAAREAIIHRIRTAFGMVLRVEL